VTWVAGASKSNIVAGTVLADTGPLTAGSYLLEILAASNVEVDVYLQQRNSTNLLTLTQQLIPFELGLNHIPVSAIFVLDDSERLRVVTAADVVVGAVSVSLFTDLQIQFATTGPNTRRQGTMSA
jgi:hypothetical protein